MAVDMFLKIDGLMGGSVDAKHAGEIDILSFSWGIHKTGSRPTFEDFQFTMRPDKALPGLELGCASGQHFVKALLSLRNAGTKAPIEFLKYELTEAVCTSAGIELDKTGIDPLPLARASFSFGKVKWTYTEQKPDGSSGASIVGGWDLGKNAPV